MQALPNSRQLQYLLALEREQHFGRAAEQCFISQSAFSIAIRELEKLLDCQLFERTNRQVRITPAGQEIASRAKAIVSQLEDLCACAQTSGSPLQGPLKLGVIPTIAPFLLPRLLPKLRRVYPELELILREEQTAVAHQQLIAGTLDLVLLALPFSLPGTNSVALFDDPFHLAFRKDTEWFKEEQAGQLAAKGKLPDEAVILLEDGHCLRDHALSECALSGRSKSAQLSPFASTSITTLLHMVAQDIGVTYIPEMALGSPLLKGLRIQTEPMPQKSFRTIGLAWRESSPFAEQYQLLGDSIASACGA